LGAKLYGNVDARERVNLTERGELRRLLTSANRELAANDRLSNVQRKCQSKHTVDGLNPQPT
jgi:hypothetical protein